MATNDPNSTKQGTICPASFATKLWNSLEVSAFYFVVNLLSPHFLFLDCDRAQSDTLPEAQEQRRRG